MHGGVLADELPGGGGVEDLGGVKLKDHEAEGAT